MAQSEASQMSAASQNSAASFKKPIIFTAMPLKGKDEVYLGPRKVDDSPQATFHYGDGKYVIQFHYTKNDKASERGGEAGASSLPDDRTMPKLDGVQFMNPGSYLD